MPLADDYDCFLLDLDGVLFRGHRAVPGAADAVADLRRAARRIVFMTNNSARTPGEVVATLTALGFEARPEEVQTSALATAELLAGRGARSCFVIGERGLRDALTGAGLGLVEDADRPADYVVVGWDRRADYTKLRDAALHVQRGARLMATNADPSYPAEDGLWPGAGALLAVITTTTGARPEVVGKPHAPLFRSSLERAGGGRPLVVGDRLDTDIAGAAALGWDSLLVLTGITSRGDLDTAPVQPTFVADDLSALASVPPERVDRVERPGLDPRGALGAE